MAKVVPVSDQEAGSVKPEELLPHAQVQPASSTIVQLRSRPSGRSGLVYSCRGGRAGVLSGGRNGRGRANVYYGVFGRGS